MIDLWGRVYGLETRTLIGRQIEGIGLAVLEPSVSRHHAHLTLDPDSNAWTLRDLGSANGTWVGDKLIEGPARVHSGERIRFGHIGFYMLEDVSKLPTTSTRGSRAVATTMRPADVNKAIEAAKALVAAPPARASDPDPAEPVPDHEEDEITNVGLPAMVFKMHEPTGGGGGLIEVNGKQVQLTTTQFELMALMIKRMASEEHQPELVRGFVRSSELIADLSWDTREPSENHVKQLVRRVRRALMKSEIGDLIESRHRFGYRLRAIPKTS
nr:FHA domain-containing protein [Kofleriaceae bacterium]